MNLLKATLNFFSAVRRRCGKMFSGCVWRVLLVLAGLLCVALVFDCLDFLGRWARHFEPFKNNAERLFYFVFIVAIVWHLRDWLARRVKRIKVSAGDYGFEVILGSYSEEKEDCGLGVPNKVCNRSASPDLSRMRLAFQFEKFAISFMSKELGVAFSSNPILLRDNIRFSFDGYAERNGRIYIVEVKATDVLYVLDRTIDLMTIFAQKLPEESRLRLTFILCVLTSKSQEDLRCSVNARHSSLPYELQVRAFKSSDFVIED